MHTPEAEMGQGIHTALGQVAAEELDIAWEQLNVISSGTHNGPLDSAGTLGSVSVMSVYRPLREAAALTVAERLLDRSALREDWIHRTGLSCRPSQQQPNQCPSQWVQARVRIRVLSLRALPRWLVRRAPSRPQWEHRRRYLLHLLVQQFQRDCCQSARRHADQ